MEIYQCYQTVNRCYKQGRSAKHVGILMHSTGAVNQELRRYVDAPERLGKNQYNNHWNKASAGKCMHAFIGFDKNRNVIVAQTLPYAYACWGCGKGTKGSYNYDPTAHIQFEICQGNNSDAGYYWRAIGVAAEYCAYLCRRFGFRASDICSHREAAQRGYASNHGDPESWMIHFGDDMAAFRARVATLLAGGALDEEEGGMKIMATVRFGSKGAAVTQMQKNLLKLGYPLPRYGADGSFGLETLAALRAYQADAGLEVDGVCGPITWASLLATAGGNEAATYTITLLDATEAERAAIVAVCGRVTVARNVG